MQKHSVPVTRGGAFADVVVTVGIEGITITMVIEGVVEEAVVDIGVMIS